MGLQWSNQPPTRPGWYFVRDSAHRRMQIIKYEEVAIAALKLAIFIPPLMQEWAGPIPQPKRPCSPALAV